MACSIQNSISIFLRSCRRLSASKPRQTHKHVRHKFSAALEGAGRWVGGSNTAVSCSNSNRQRVLGNRGIYSRIVVSSDLFDCCCCVSGAHPIRTVKKGCGLHQPRNVTLNLNLNLNPGWAAYCSYAILSAGQNDT